MTEYLKIAALLFIVPVITLICCEFYARDAKRSRKKYSQRYGKKSAGVDFVNYTHSDKLEDRNNFFIGAVIAGISILFSAVCGALVSVSISVEQYPKGTLLGIQEFTHWIVINLSTTWPVVFIAIILSYFVLLTFIIIAGKVSWSNLSKSKFIQDFYFKIHTGEINIHKLSCEYIRNIEDNIDTFHEENTTYLHV